MLVHRPYKYSTDQHEQDEASIALLPKMSGDKLHLESGKVAAVQTDSEASTSDEVNPYKKAPWWSYIWVCKPRALFPEKKF